MIPTEGSPYLVSTESHGGKGGRANEDRFKVETFALDEAGKRTALVAVIADGIGGQRAGHVAAELAVDAILASVGTSDASQPTGILQAAIIKASQVILQRAESRREWAGMGSTCLCAWIVGERLYAASVGTSRLYLLRGHHLQELNVVRHLRGDEIKDKEDPLRGYLGSKTQVEIDLKLSTDLQANTRPSVKNQGLRLQPNDRLLLCSDGLGDALKPEEVVEILGERSVEESAPALVQFALEKGTAKNMTAVVIAMPPGKPPLAPAPFNWRRAVNLSLSFVILVFIALLAWYLWISSLQIISPPEPTPIHTLTPIATNTPAP